MSESLQSLVKASAIEFEEIKDRNALASIAELRNKIPLPILGHYDRLVAHARRERRWFASGLHRLPHAPARGGDHVPEARTRLSTLRQLRSVSSTG